MTFEPVAPRTCSRRQFLALAVPLLGAGVSRAADGQLVPGGPGHCPRQSELPETVVDLEDVLARYFEHGDARDVGALGRAYMSRFGGDGCALLDDLSQTVRRIADIARTDQAVTALEAAVTEDFATGRAISLGGWQLAATEARLCTLTEYLASA